MPDQDKLTREEVLKELSIADDTLSLYEHELEMSFDPFLGDIDSFTAEDIQSIKVFHRLRESGLTFSEIKLLASFSEILKTVDFEGNQDVKNLLKLSPVYRLKQSLNLSRQELNFVRKKIQELEETLKKETENKESFNKEKFTTLEMELDLKQKTINNMDRKLQEAVLLKTQLENELQSYKEGKSTSTGAKGKKARELQKALTEKETELEEIKTKNKELSAESEKYKSEAAELSERVELIEDGVSEMEHEIEERYLEQIETMQSQIQGLVDKKQKEWETYYIQSNEQHRKELLTLQRSHQSEILKLKRKIKEQIDEINVLKIGKNPLLGLIKIGEKIKDKYTA
jgi:myosin heavy subunit